MASIDDIETIVIVMLENRSFDNVLGHLSFSGEREDIDGLKECDLLDNAYDNGHNNLSYRPYECTDGMFLHDLPHKRAGIATQLGFINGQYTMGGFANAYVTEYHSETTELPPMAYMSAGSVPMSRFLAQEYLVCNRWFTPLPTGTQPNRCMAFTGTSLIDDNVPARIPYIKKEFIFNWLHQYKVRWRLYHCGFSLFTLFDISEYLVPAIIRYGHLENFQHFKRDFKEEAFNTAPQVIVIEPEYADNPVKRVEPNDNHPPYPMRPGEQLLANVYSALTANPERWAKTLMIVTYDEHGGFFDHVPPLEIDFKRPVNAHEDFGDHFVSTGPRVPTFIVSPLVDRGTVSDPTLNFDHTSILQLLAEKFAGGADNYSESVTYRRSKGISSVSALLSGSLPRTDLPCAPKIPDLELVRAEIVEHGKTANQIALEKAARQLLSENPDGALKEFPELAALPVKES